NKELEKLFDQQSAETDLEKRKRLVWEIDKKLQEDIARPIILHSRRATCWSPQVKGVTIMTNSSYNGWRFEDVWLDRLVKRTHELACLTAGGRRRVEQRQPFHPSRWFFRHESARHEITDFSRATHDEHQTRSAAARMKG